VSKTALAGFFGWGRLRFAIDERGTLTQLVFEPPLDDVMAARADDTEPTLNANPLAFKQFNPTRADRRHR